MRLVVFDMDGTLIDSAILIVELLTNAFEAIGEVAPSPKQIRSISGISLAEAMQILAPNLPAARLEALVAAYRVEYQRQAGGPREALFEGARAALERLRARPDTIIAVATGKGLQSATALLTAHGMLDWFDSVQTPTHNRGKPDPQMLETAMQRVGATPAQTVMIGDTVHDMRMAKAGRVHAIGVAWGYHEVDELLGEGADIVIDRFDQLDAAIEQLLE